MNLNKNPQNCFLFCSGEFTPFFPNCFIKLHKWDTTLFIRFELFLQSNVNTFMENLFCEPICHVNQQQIQEKRSIKIPDWMNETRLFVLNISKCVSTMSDANLQQTLDKSVKESATQIK